MSIEQLCNTSRDVPRSVIIKTDALRLGVTFSSAAKEAVKDMNIHFKGHFIFSQDMEHTVVTREKIPNWFCLKRDDTTIQARAGASSPYTIDWIDGKFVFRDEAGIVEEVYFDPSPRWASLSFEDGTPYQAIAVPTGKDAVLGFMTFVCDRWARNEQCLFCDIGANLQKKMGSDKLTVTTAKPEMLAEVFHAAQREPGFRHFSLTAGSVIGKRDGKSETEWYCDYLNTIGERLNGNWMSSYINIQPKPKDDIKKLHETGVPALMLNLEVWGERLFNIVCPGKASLIGWEESLRRVIDAVDVFGKGRIQSNFVAGVEMAQPWGFKDSLSAVKHTLAGFEYLMAHGGLPRTNVWAAEPGSALAGHLPPPLEYYLELGRGYLELRQKYNFPFPFWGWCRCCYKVDAIPEWDYYLWGKNGQRNSVSFRLNSD